MKVLKKSSLLLIVLNILFSKVYSQLPALYLPKSTCASIIHDIITSKLAQNSTLKNYHVTVPSIFAGNTGETYFYTILTSDKVDYSKLNPTVLIGTMDEAFKMISTSNAIVNYALVKGMITNSNNVLSVQLTEYKVSNTSLETAALDFTKNISVVQALSYKELAKINYGALRNDSVKLNITVNPKGITFINSNNINVDAIINSTPAIANEADATGVTSIVVFSPFAFINTILKTKKFRYELNDKNDFRFSEGVLKSDGGTHFTFIFSGKVDGVKLQNTYNVDVFFKEENFTIKDIIINKKTGNNALESTLIKTALNTFKGKYIGYFVPTFDSEKSFQLNLNGTTLNVKLTTLFGHVVSDNLILVNTLETSKL